MVAFQVEKGSVIAILPIGEQAWDPSPPGNNPFLWVYHLSRRFTPSFPTTEPQKVSPLDGKGGASSHTSGANILNFLSAPLLNSFPVYSFFAQESIARFRDAISRVRASARQYSHSLHLALEACSTISRLKLELPPRMSDIVEALSYHLIQCISQHDWTTIFHVVHSRRDAGLLKLVEVQFADEDCWADDIREDDFEMRFAKWDSPR